MENLRGNKMRQTYPVSQLKTVAEETDEKCEVEKILDHRVRLGKLEYFVKWADYPLEECSWVKESEFETTECIDAYWDSLTAPTDAILDDKALLVQTKPVNWLYTAIVSLLILIFKCQLVMGQTAKNATTLQLEDTFNYCNTSSRMMLSRNWNCNRMQFNGARKSPIEKWHVLSKRAHMIDGLALQCELYMIVKKRHVSFFGTETVTRTEAALSITENGCHLLWLTNCHVSETHVSFILNPKFHMNSFEHLQISRSDAMCQNVESSQIQHQKRSP